MSVIFSLFILEGIVSWLENYTDFDKMIMVSCIFPTNVGAAPGQQMAVRRKV